MLFIAISWSASKSMAQNNPVFDRPGVADGPFITEIHAPQLESGFTLSSESELRSAINPGVMLRVGLSKKNEFRGSYNYIPPSLIISQPYTSKELTNVALGIKQHLLKEKNKLPETSVLINIFAPLNSKNEIYGNYLSYELGFNFLNNLNNQLSVNYNLNSIFNPGNDLFILNYSLCLNFNPFERAGFFIEQFSYADIKRNDMEWGFDTGMVYYPSALSQIDLSVVFNQLGSKSLYSFLVGYSHKLNFKPVE